MYDFGAELHQASKEFRTVSSRFSENTCGRLALFLFKHFIAFTRKALWAWNVFWKKDIILNRMSLVHRKLFKIFISSGLSFGRLCVFEEICPFHLHCPFFASVIHIIFIIVLIPEGSIMIHLPFLILVMCSPSLSLSLLHR